MIVHENAYIGMPTDSLKLLEALEGTGTQSSCCSSCKAAKFRATQGQRSGMWLLT